MKARSIIYFLIAILFIVQGILFYYALDYAFYIIGGSIVLFFLGAGFKILFNNSFQDRMKKRKENIPPAFETKTKKDKTGGQLGF